MTPKRTILLAALAVALIILGLACAPPIAHSAIDGRVKFVHNWSIEVVPDTTSHDLSSKLEEVDKFGSRYRHEEHARTYVDLVKARLKSSYDFSFVENHPIEGRLLLTVHGARSKVVYGYRSSAAQVATESGVSDEDRFRTETGDPVTDNDPLPFAIWADNVSYVEVTIIGVDGSNLGQIFVGTRESNKVKPKRVADAVARLVRSGQSAKGSD